MGTSLAETKHCGPVRHYSNRPKYKVQGYDKESRGSFGKGTSVGRLKLTGIAATAYHRRMESSETQSAAPAMFGLSRALVVSTRPKQWTKNLIIYFALFFTIGEVWEPGDTGEALSLVGKTTLGFLLFSALSGGVYLVNDILDVERDRLHPKKRYRPVALGTIPVPVAWGAAATLSALTLSLSFVLEPDFGWVSSGYLLLMLTYSTMLKRLAVLDVLAISAGFVLRAVAGAAVLQVPISPWLYICTGLGALLIALGKRRSELSVAGEVAGAQRDTLEWYTTSLLDRSSAVVALATLLAYSLYALTASNLPENHSMAITIPFVALGLLRYTFLVHTTDLGENPEDIFVTDLPLMGFMVLWLASAASILTVYG